MTKIDVYIEELDDTTLLIYGLDGTLETVDELKKIDGVLDIRGDDDGCLTVFLASPEISHDVQLFVYALTEKDR